MTVGSKCQIYHLSYIKIVVWKCFEFGRVLNYMYVVWYRVNRWSNILPLEHTDREINMALSKVSLFAQDPVPWIPILTESRDVIPY